MNTLLYGTMVLTTSPSPIAVGCPGSEASAQYGGPSRPSQLSGLERSRPVQVRSDQIRGSCSTVKYERSRFIHASSNVHPSGSRSGLIHQHDVRVADHHLCTLRGHTQEVCGLTWSPDGRYLASGGNDNLVNIWPSTQGGAQTTLHSFNEHQGAVKVGVAYSRDTLRGMCCALVLKK